MTDQVKKNVPEPSDNDKQKMYDSLPQEHRDKQTYTEWVTEAYNNQWNSWMPWVEDKYLQWFGKDNKASYATKDTLDKSKVTGISQVDNLQDGVNSAVSGQFGKDGLLQPIGDMASKEGVNRAERGGQDESGSYGGPMSGVTDPMANTAKGAGGALSGGASKLGGMVGMGGGK